MKPWIITIAALMLTITSCSRSDNRASKSTPASAPQVAMPSADVEYGSKPLGRIDLLSVDFDNIPRSRRDSLIEAMGAGVDVYLQLMGARGDRDQGLRSISAGAPVKVFGPDVEKSLSDLTALEAQLGQVCGSIDANYPAAHISDIYGVISPYRQGIVTSDSTVLVVTNLYLGADYPGYRGFDEYFRSTRVSERIPYDVAEAALAAGYPYRGGDNPTALSRMLYQGALVYCVMSTMLHPDAAMALGVTSDQFNWLNQHRADIWRTFIDRNMLYSTIALDADKLVAPAGHSPWLHPDAPGRVGRYVGLEIVCSYLATHPDTPPAWLLTPQFYAGADTLSEAAYNPLHQP